MQFWTLKFVLAGMLICSAIAQAARADRPTTAPAGSVAVVVQLEGEINDYSYRDLVRRLDEAKRMGASVVILEIDSYGGAVTAGLDTSRHLKQRQDLRVVAFVKEKAISAGAMIALACDEIWMRPHSALGDAAPIVISPGGGLENVDPTNRAKMESPVVEDFRDSARRNGYDPLLAESMVVMGREVYYVKNRSGEKRFVDGEQYKKLQAQGGWEPVIADRNPVDATGSLLTAHAELAVQLGLAKGLASSAEEVAEKYGWRVIGRLDRTGGDRLIAFLASMSVRSFLMTILIIAVYMAFHAPGHGMPEAVVAICLALLLGIPLMTGYATWWEILMVLAGVALLAIEVFVIPGMAVAGISGLVLIVLGLVLTFVPKEPAGIPGILPSLGSTRQGLENGLIAMAGSMIVAGILCAMISRYLPRIPIFGRLVLTKTVGGGTADGQTVTESADAVAATANVNIGEEGIAATDLRPGGKAQFPDPTTLALRLVDVICDSGFVNQGSKLRVQELRGSTVVVRKVE